MIKRFSLTVLTLLLLLIPSYVTAGNAISTGKPICHSELSAHVIASEAKQSGAQGEFCEGSSVASSCILLRTASRDSLLAFSVPSCCPDSKLRLRVENQQSESGISVLNSGVEMHFPSKLIFNLEAESSVEIVDARLHYQVDKMNYARVTSEGWADFTPASRIETNWTWDMRRASLPPGAAITYWWTIKDDSGSIVETIPSVAYFDDLRYQWRSLTEGELNLFWYEGDESFAQELMDVCEEGLARLTEDIGASPEKPIKIYIYDSAADLQGAMIFPQEWTGGVAFTEFGTIAIGISPGNLDWGSRALVHELTHLVVHQATFSPYGRLPVWLDEGLAMYNEGEPDPHFQSWLEKAISESKLISVRSLCSPFSAQSEKAYLSYAQSYSLVEYLLSNYGQEKMLQLLNVFKQGSTYDEALSQVYGFDIDGLDSRWRASLVNPAAITVGAEVLSCPQVLYI